MDEYLLLITSVVFFEPIYVCIPSISITSISSALRNSSNFSPKLFIQLNTATWLTFRKRPMERNPNPSRYSISASRLSFSGFPICLTVKRYLQFLHKYRCLFYYTRFTNTMAFTLWAVFHFKEFLDELPQKYKKYTKLTMPFFYFYLQVLRSYIWNTCQG